MKGLDPELLADRARDLEAAGLNGLRLVLVELLPQPGPPDHARLRLQFYNAVAVGDMDDAVNIDGRLPWEIFGLRGGRRVVAGDGPGQLRVESVSATAQPDTLDLFTSGIGDYSSYQLTVVFADPADTPLIDPLFATIAFKFRPGCFNLDCVPARVAAPAPGRTPEIDYLARDFDSIKHVLINAMRERVPGWEPTSEADLDQVIIDLLAADADELCDYQDRVMNEAYLGLARKRVSLARHARLMDYHVHQGSQAQTWLVAEVANDLDLPAGTGVWTAEAWTDSGAVIFTTRTEQRCLRDLNRLELYTWGGVVTALESGATSAELALPATLNPLLEGDAQILRDHLRDARFCCLALEEELNPTTGTVNGRDPLRRALLRLRDGDAAAETGFDPLAGHFFVRVHWLAADRLTRRWCFATRPDGGALVGGLSAFRGNLVRAGHGRPHRAVFRPPGSEIGPSDDKPLTRLDETWWEDTPWGVIARLPRGPLGYGSTPAGGETPPLSTAAVSVSGIAGTWQERIDLIGSDGDDPHYLVETDEEGLSLVRFGTGANGMRLDPDATVTCDYQVGRGSEGNVGADTLTGFDAAAIPGLLSLRNPFDVVDGRDPEPRDEIIRRAPEAYRQRQLRAVTLADYVARAEALPGVSHAHARYAWTGSWRTVQVAVDPAGTTQLPDAERARIAAHLDAVRLVGEDLEVRPARYVGLDVELVACAHPDYWPEDLEAELRAELSAGYTDDGRPGFFHPDAWTFGQPLHASALIARAMAVTGVERVLSASLRRLDAGRGSGPVVTIDPADLIGADVERLDVRPFEIIQVANDPDHLEHGRLVVDIRGGRQ